MNLVNYIGMNDLRILSHGKITDLSLGFKLADGATFSIILLPKNNSSADIELVNCRCVCDTEASELPVAVGDWTPAKIQEIPAESIDLTVYDVYWGAGETVKTE